MKKNVALLLILLGLITLNAGAQKRADSPVEQKAPEWKKIIPMKSTREDVVSILGPGITVRAPGYWQTLHEFKNINIQVTYSLGVCSKIEKDWNIAEGTVKFVYVDFEPTVDFLSLGVDSKMIFDELTRQNANSPSSAYDYEKGIRATVDNKLNVNELKMSPTAEYDYLACNQ